MALGWLKVMVVELQEEMHEEWRMEALDEKVAALSEEEIERTVLRLPQVLDATFLAEPSLAANVEYHAPPVFWTTDMAQQVHGRAMY